MKAKYYVRVAEQYVQSFEDHLTTSGTEFRLLNSDMANGEFTRLYSVIMESEEAMALKLTIPLIGCLNFHKTVGKLHTHSRS
jgi:hypothetical protein